jgi:hypothetical protein
MKNRGAAAFRKLFRKSRGRVVLVAAPVNDGMALFRSLGVNAYLLYILSFPIRFW